MAEQLPALQVVLPLLGALVAALLRRSAIAWALTMAICILLPIIAFSLLLKTLATGPISYAMGGWAPPHGIEYRIDVANALILLLVSVMAAAVAAYAPRSVGSEIPEEKHGWYYSMYLTCITGLLGMAASGDAFNIFVFMEISSLAMYVMIALGRDRRALVAAFQYLVLGTLGATFYVIGVGLLFVMTGTLNLVDIATRIADIEESRPIIAALAFLTVGISLKLALFPLHLWLPNAYAYAPSTATAFLSSTATKVAIYLLLRFMFSVFGVASVFGAFKAGMIILLLSIAAMVLPSIVAIFQSNIKRMLAYSSVAQVGYITLGIALASQAGLTGGIAHIVNHAVIKACLFLAIGCVVFRTGTVRIEELAGIGRKMPMTMAAFVVAGLGLIGVPGTAGFVSKWYLVVGALEADLWWVAATVVVSSVIAVVYIGRVVEVAWFREPTASVAEAHEPPIEMLVITWLLAIYVVGLGFATDLTAGVAADAAIVLLSGYGAGAP